MMTPSNQEIWLKEEHTFAFGYNVCIFFFNRLWLTFKPKVISFFYESCSFYEDFFLNTCLIGSAPTKEWEEAVCKSLSISKEEAKKRIFSSKDLFFTVVEFSKLHNGQYYNFFAQRHQDHFEFLLNLLNFMLNDPENYRIEWNYWRMAILDSTKVNQGTFDWENRLTIFDSSKKLPSEESKWSIKMYSVPEGYDRIASFLGELHPFLIPKAAFLNKKHISNIHGFLTSAYDMHGGAYNHAWNEAIYQHTKILKKDQKELSLSEEDLFFSVIELSKYYLKNFEFSLEFLIYTLEEMIVHPHFYPAEWFAWRRALADQFSIKPQTFNWDQLPD